MGLLKRTSRRADGHRRLRLSILPLLVGLAISTGLLQSDSARAEPWYVSFSIGGNASPGITLTSRSNDRASICDEYINPRALSVPACTSPDRGAGDGWLAPFDGGAGISAEAEFGYRFSPRLRIAAVYAYNHADFDQSVSSTNASGVDFDKINDELSVGDETLGTVVSHEVFLVGYRDWPNRSRWTPFAGAGAGFARLRKDFSWVWARSTDPQDILTGRDQPNAQQIRQNLAGTVSTGRSALRDTIPGYVLMAGAEREISDSLSVGIKVQWKRFGRFESGPYGGGLLRSHAPNLRLDGSEPVSTWSETRDTDRLVIALTMRYALP